MPMKRIEKTNGKDGACCRLTIQLPHVSHGQFPWPLVIPFYPTWYAPRLFNCVMTIQYARRLLHFLLSLNGGSIKGSPDYKEQNPRNQGLNAQFEDLLSRVGLPRCGKIEGSNAPSNQKACNQTAYDCS